MTDAIQEAVMKEILAQLGHQANQPAVPQPVLSEGPSNKIYYLMFFLMLLSSSMMVGIFYYKQLHPTIVNSPSPAVADARPVSPQLPPLPPPPAGVDKAALEEVNKKIDYLTQRVEKLYHRQWLLAASHNENVCVLKSLGLYGNFVALEEDWKLSRMPEFIQMTDEDRQKLLEFVKR